MVTIKKLRVFITAIVFLLALSVLGGFSSTASAATVGDQLLQPEDRWERYDDAAPEFNYIGKWSSYQNMSTAFHQRTHHTGSKGDSIEFDFIGTKLRIITR